MTDILSGRGNRIMRPDLDGARPRELEIRRVQSDRMDLDQTLCFCFHIPKRKLVNFTR